MSLITSPIQELVPPPRMTDEEVLETFARLDDVIRMRMLMSEVVPPPMRKYRIGKFQKAETL